jgi:hypothetical protein
MSTGTQPVPGEELGPAVISGDGDRICLLRRPVAVGEREADVPARGNAVGTRQRDEQGVEVGAVALPDPETVGHVAQPPARHRLVVVHVLVDPVVERVGARHDAVLAGRLALCDGADLVVDLHRA